jgi:hypothetical protein
MPEVPVRVRVVLPPIAEPSAEIEMFCGVPGVSIKDEGCAVTPVGSPLIATETVLLKPFDAAAATLICCAGPPGARVTVPGEDEREKSAGGLELPPHEASKRQRKRPEQAKNVFEKELVI